MLVDTECIGYSIDECDLDKNSILEESDNLPEERCQKYCEITSGCKFYLYDRNQGECKTSNMSLNDYVSTCKVYAGPIQSSVAKCLPGISSIKRFSRPDACKVAINLIYFENIIRYRHKITDKERKNQYFCLI